LLRTADSRSLNEHFDDEANSIVRLSQTADGIEGVAAFLDKRQPAFS
jgi:2-(1,2-epoxy-1,2-dihydrophenyl)acetyl-CoA isomerase